MKRESDIINHLQRKIVKRYGKQISTATDCEKLADALKQDFNANISPQTLRRFFGLIKSTSKTSIFTLDLLSNYCGFKDYENFRQSCSNSELELFFGSNEDSGKNYWRKSEELCRQIIDSPELLVKIHHRLLTFPLARKYFMENHPMRDMMGTVYSQYFTSYLKYNHNNEAKIFAYGFLFHSAFLLENTELMELYYRKVSETDLSEEVHVIPAGLKYGVQLLYADFIKDENLFRKYFNEMKETRIKYINASEKSVCSFEYTVLESLIFTERTEEIQFLVEKNTPHKLKDYSYIPEDRKQTHDEVWKILCAAAFQKIGDLEKSNAYLNMVNLKNLGIGWKKYYTLFYHFTQVQLSEPDKREEIILKIQQLIDKTHLVYFETQLQNWATTKQLILS